MEHRVYQDDGKEPELRSEWVLLRKGEVCVRELTAAEYAGMRQQSARPSIDPRGGSDPTAIILVQIVMSCYDSEEPGARPLFPTMEAAGRLPFEDFQKVMAAIARVNGLEATEQEILRDFLQASGAPTNSSSKSTASSTSTVSRVR